MMERCGAATAFGDVGRFLPLHHTELNHQLVGQHGQQDALSRQQEAIAHGQPDHHTAAFYSPTSSAASATSTGQQQHRIIADAYSLSSLSACPQTPMIKTEQSEQQTQAEFNRLTYHALGHAGHHHHVQDLNLNLKLVQGTIPQNHNQRLQVDALEHLHVAPLADPSTSQLVHSKSLVRQPVLHRQQLANFEAFQGLSRPLPPPQAYQNRPNNQQLNSATAATATTTATLSSPHTSTNIIFPTSATCFSHLSAPFQSSQARRGALYSNHQSPTGSTRASAPLSDHHHYHHLSMAAPFDPQSDELARMQELSNNWEPEASGPLVSERLPSSALTQEYANADPAYRVKTESLPQKYAQYRRCKGDGHCGWRAIAFCYFEALLRTGDKQKFLFEEARLKSLQNMLKDIGLSEHVYEDFVDDTIELLREISTINDEGADLLRAFNDFGRSQSVITFLKLLTSASIQRNPDQWQPFVEIPIVEYCKNRIDPAKAEIEHVGLSALVELLTKPAGIAVEVLYLDRSPGEEVTTYRFDPVDQNGMTLSSAPTVRLLYRPGHYDILYKLEDLPVRAPVQPPAAPLNLVVGISETPDPHCISKLPFPVNSFVEIPGLAFFPEPPPVSHPEWPSMVNQFDYSPSIPHSPPVSTHVQTIAVSAPQYQSPPNSIHDFYGSNNMAVSSAQPSTPISPVSAVSTSMASHAPFMDTKEPFRPSKYAVEHDYIAMTPHPAFLQTSIFKNSHYNTAHFNNPEFTPEQWKPEDEYRGTNRKRPSAH